MLRRPTGARRLCHPRQGDGRVDSAFAGPVVSAQIGRQTLPFRRPSRENREGGENPPR